MEYAKGLKKLTTLTGWRQFLKILSKKEKIIFSLFLFLFLVSFSFLSIVLYFKNTEIQPAAGGIFVEGMLGQPRFINPIFAPLSDVDRDLTEIIFSGLMKFNPEGKIIPDLAGEYQIFENGKIWEISLKENLFWSDNIPLTVDDVIFTIETIQNPDVKSPLRPSWLGVRVKKISAPQRAGEGVRFELDNPSAVFLENLTLKIIPKHIWKNISPQNFPLSLFNLTPIGSGPYQLKNLVRDKEGKIILLDLIRNPNYHGKTPNLQQISFQFFVQEENLLSAIENDEISGFAGSNLTNWTNWTNWNLTNWTLPRYFAVFLNPNQSKILAKKEVRQTLNYGTNKKEVIERVFGKEGKIVDSPILPEIYGFKTPPKVYQFNLEKAKLLLEKAGFFETQTGIREKIVKKELAFQFKSDLGLGSKGKEVKELQKCLAKDKEIYPDGEISEYFGSKTKTAVIKFQEKYRQDILKPFGLEKGTGEVKKATRKKLNEICFEKPEETILFKFSLATVNQPKLIELANLLKEQWQALGAEIEIKTYDISALEKEIIKPRNYQAILFGQVLGIIPDPFPFWHSSQKKDPGLNLALYENKENDKLLEEARQTTTIPANNEEKRKELLEKFQEILIEDAPVVFLYNPDYLYFISKEIKGVVKIRQGAGNVIIADPSQRFSNIEEWYIKTKRAWK